MEKNINQSKDNHIIPMTSVSSGKLREVKQDVYYYTNQIVNVVFVGYPNGKWVLIDAGMPKSGKEIVKAAEERFGKDSKPEAIILTHGHFDHVGSIVHLLDHWEGINVYAHPLEFPFLTGKQAYPEPDPTVEGGMLAKISKLYPHEPIDITSLLLPLSANRKVPHLEDWVWIYTPGHTPGHVSFYRERDGVLIAGDAFVTVKQDEFYKVLVQKEEVCGPPPYLTTDWELAKESVRKLYGLNPSVAITGHGTHMSGPDLLEGLEKLSKQFDEIALPKYGKYVNQQNKESGI